MNETYQDQVWTLNKDGSYSCKLSDLEQSRVPLAAPCCKKLIPELKPFQTTKQTETSMWQGRCRCGVMLTVYND